MHVYREDVKARHVCDMIAGEVPPTLGGANLSIAGEQMF
jgi:hypothetical protein